MSTNDHRLGACANRRFRFDPKKRRVMMRRHIEFLDGRAANLEVDTTNAQSGFDKAGEVLRPHASAWYFDDTPGPEIGSKSGADPVRRFRVVDRRRCRFRFW